MASNELIDDIISQQAFAQVDKMKGEMEALMNKFIQAGLGVEALNKALTDAKGLGALSSNISTATQATTQYIDAGKQILELQKKITLATSAEGDEIAKLRLQLQALNASNKDRVKDSQAEEGSINSLRVRLKELQKGYDDMGKAMRDSFKGQTLVADIQKIDAELKKLEGGSGRFQRNVGNYSNATFQLSQSLRELPAFAFSAQTGILALSNNLPMLVDSFNQVKASTGSAGSALAVFAKSVFTFTNLFTIALGLFTVFYKEILAFATGTKMANKELTNLSKTVGADIAQSKMYIGIIENMNIATEKRIIAAKKLIEIYPETLKNYSAEEIAAGKASEAIDRITNSIIAYARIKAIQTDIDRLATKEYELQGQKQIEIHDQLQMRYEKDAIQSRLKLLKPATNAYDIEIDKLNTINGKISQSQNLVKLYDDQLKIVAGSMTTLSARASDLLPKVLDEKAPNKEKKPKKEAEVNRIEELKNQYENERKVAQTHYEKGEYDYLLYQHNLIMIDEKYSKIKIDARTQKEKDSLIDLNLALAKNTRESYLGLGKLASDSWEEAWKKYKAGSKGIINENMLIKAKEDIDKFKAYLATLPPAEIKVKLEFDWKDHLKEILATMESISSAIGAIGTAFEIQNNIELAALDNKTKANERYYEDEQLRIKSSGKSKQEQEKELIKVEAQRSAQNRAIEREKADLARKQAKRQKMIDIAQISLSTSAAIMGYLKDPGGYVGIALSIAAGITGAAQIAKAQATPLPEFAKGTDSSPEGYAIVGEKGTELVTDPSGKSWLTPAKDTITYLKKGSKVTTNEKLMEMVKNSAYVQLANMNTPITSDMYSKTLVEQFETLTSKVDKLSNIMQDKAMSVQIQGNYDHYIHVRNNIR